MEKKVENFILGFPGLRKLGNLLWWLEILFRGCKNHHHHQNVKLLQIYRFDHNLNVAQVIGVNLMKMFDYRSQKYE